MKTQPLSLIVPAFNEENTIEHVVNECKIYGDVIVVDDCSNDSTALLAVNSGALVVKHTINLGYDHALNSGILKALSLGYKFAITFDADGQHDPKSIPSFLEHLNNGYAVVIGNRDKKNRLLETAVCSFSSLLFGVSDPLSGMKGYNLDVINKIGFFRTFDSIGSEFSMRAACLGFPVINVDINIRPRKDISRFGNGLLVNIKILFVVIRSSFVSLLKIFKS